MSDIPDWRYCPHCGDRTNPLFEEAGKSFYQCTNGHVHSERKLREADP